MKRVESMEKGNITRISGCLCSIIIAPYNIGVIINNSRHTNINLAIAKDSFFYAFLG
ncbi:hypothetical protein N752_27315 [Desulforamulus aquiferis]|nr:hypothetical protein N752_27315 [Desulforamulus aquiferis]